MMMMMFLSETVFSVRDGWTSISGLQFFPKLHTLSENPYHTLKGAFSWFVFVSRYCFVYLQTAIWLKVCMWLIQSSLMCSFVHIVCILISDRSCVQARTLTRQKREDLFDDFAALKNSCHCQLVSKEITEYQSLISFKHTWKQFVQISIADTWSLCLNYPRKPNFSVKSSAEGNIWNILRHFNLHHWTVTLSLLISYPPHTHTNLPYPHTHTLTSPTHTHTHTHTH